MLCPQLHRVPRDSKETESSLEQKALSQRSEELTTMSLLLLEYVKINCLGTVVDKLSREGRLPLP